MTVGGLSRRRALGLAAGCAAGLPLLLAGCALPAARSASATGAGAPDGSAAAPSADISASSSAADRLTGSSRGDRGGQSHAARAEELRRRLGVVSDLRPALDHGEKGTAFQRYLVLHDTDVDAPGAQIVESWDSSGRGIAAHFVVDRDGFVTQCVGLERIAHHAGYGDTGHNQAFGVEEDGRDDKGPGAGDLSFPLGQDFADYGMNSHSVGVELVHLGEAGEEYPEEQLAALDLLVEMIDEHFRARGAQDAGAIIDHKAWRTTNPDTSQEFASYLLSYQRRRRHE